MSPTKSDQKAAHLTKKCPYCWTYVKIDARQCDACKRKIGEVNEYGIAKKPFNLMSYIMALIAVGSLGAFIFYMVTQL